MALTGATGIAGEALIPLADLTLGRRALPGKPHRAFDLTGPAPDLSGVETLIHAAFSHLPGKYRGGEGDDPTGFLAANRDGTKRLFDAAARQGVKRVIFLSSRAVFDGLPPGTDLPENRAPDPQSLYGQTKLAAEAHLAALPLTGLSLRATGLYGPGRAHKWRDLFADYRAGKTIAPRRATEVHTADLAQAVRLLITESTPGPVHLSDILLDRHDLLAEVQRLTACPHPLPERATTPVSQLRCARLHSLGWVPGGQALLHQSLATLLA
ncbi:NAD-dependent dehydratase [Rhodobacteraceae bacterium PD-2]|nr:NAD-dependent dehydratase [Rhodobacteraceae bacterium PD-2]